MARAFKRKGDRFVAKMDPTERGVVAGLMDQTRELVAPPDRVMTGDVFEDLVAGLGVSLAAEDQHLDGSSQGDAQGDARRDAQDGPTMAEDAAGLIDRDPALDRLLPTAHRGDDQVAAEFRRLTEYDLRDRKATNLSTAIGALRSATGDKLELSRPQAEAMVIALTDTRLLLGERLGLRTDEDALVLDERVAALDADAPAVYAASFYDFLTWFQESLTTALMGRSHFF